MFKKILVGLDLTDSNAVVLEKALGLASATGASLMLFHALVGDRDGGPTMPVSITGDYYAVLNEQTWEQYRAQWRDYEQRSLSALQQHVQTALEVGVTAEFTQIAGTPGSAICQLASTWDADLIIVGSHGRRGLSELFLGSVSNYVTHHAPCSVFVVRLENIGEKAPDTVTPTLANAAKTV